MPAFEKLGTEIILLTLGFGKPRAATLAAQLRLRGWYVLEVFNISQATKLMVESSAKTRVLLLESQTSMRVVTAIGVPRIILGFEKPTPVGVLLDNVLMGLEEPRKRE